MTHSGILQIIGACALLAAIPASVWGYIFYKKDPQAKFPMWLTFTISGLAVFPILLYRLLWEFFPWMNFFEFARQYEHITLGFENFFLIPLSVIITFMIVGLIEEVMKMSSVHAVGDHFIGSVDDAMEFSIIAALGFSFVENIIYFLTIWMSRGPEHLFIPFVFRSVFSTFAHILFSGIFGYFYGIAHFAKPELQKEITDRRMPQTRFLHRLFRFKTKQLFHEEKMFEGLAIAVLLHAAYNVFLEMNWMFLMVPSLVFGYMLLSYLMRLKRNSHEHGLLLCGEYNHEHNPKSTPSLISAIFKRH